MLQTLKLADQLAELLARLEVFDRHDKGLVPGARQAGGGAGAAQVQRAFERGLARVDSADDGVGVDLDVGQGDARGVVGATMMVRSISTPEAFGSTRNRVVAVVRLRRHDQGVGDMAVRDEALRAVQPEAVAAGGSRSWRCGWAGVGTLIERERQDGLAGRDLRQPGGLLVGQGGVDQHARGQDRGAK